MENYGFQDPRVAALDFPRIAENLPYASGLKALTESVKDGGTPLHYNVAEDSYFEPLHPGDINVVGKSVALGTDDLYNPGRPLVYYATVYTDRGQQESGMKAQLMREIQQLGSSQKRIVGYQLNIDGTVDAHEVIVTGNDAEIRPGRKLEAPEIEELNDQLGTLG